MLAVFDVVDGGSRQPNRLSQSALGDVPVFPLRPNMRTDPFVELLEFIDRAHRVQYSTTVSKADSQYY